jgi:hypothetical protein
LADNLPAPNFTKYKNPKTMETQTTPQTKTIDVNAKEWFDKVNGNSYFSAEIVINYGQPDAQTIVLPFQYGYGDAYIYAALRELKDAGYITADNTADLRINGVILRTHKQKNCKKRELAN